MKNAYIIGAGGHGYVLASILHGRYATIRFVDSTPKTTDVLAQADFFNQIDAYAKDDVFLAIGNNAVRIQLYERLQSLGIRPANCISSHAFIAHNAEIGHGVVICPGSVIGARAVIGHNTIVNTLSSVDHDCILGDHSQVTAGVTFGGTTHVGKNCFFGIKSATIPNITIGDNSVVMAGSMVYKDVPENVMVGGNPARVVKALGEGIS